MPLTPEINRSVKFSPYGKPIRKSLLTPCRPMGLSRKIKTPVNCNSFSANESLSPLVTPLNTNTPVSKTQTEDSSLYQLNKRFKRDVTENKTVKKCLDQNFKSTLLEELIDTVPNDVATKENISSVNVLMKDSKMKVKTHNFSECKSEKFVSNLKKVQISMPKLSEEDIANYKSSSPNNLEHLGDREIYESSEEESSEEVIKVTKKRAVISSDEEDLVNFSSETKEQSNECLNDLKIANQISGAAAVTLCEEQLSRNCIKEDSDINKETELDSNVILSGSSTKSENNVNMINKKFTTNSVILSDDEDFVKTKDNKRKLTLIRKESDKKYEVKKKDKNKTKNFKTTKSNEKCTTILQSTNSSLSIFDEDDAFTSTPERQKNEKISLIEKIKNLEIQVKEKQKKLDNLKQAEIYKTKHNTKELKNLTEIWRKGCIRGLSDLLTKLQTHGPMTMSALLNNLHISNDIAQRCLKLKLGEET